MLFLNGPKTEESSSPVSVSSLIQEHCPSHQMSVSDHPHPYILLAAPIGHTPYCRFLFCSACSTHKDMRSINDLTCLSTAAVSLETGSNSEILRVILSQAQSGAWYIGSNIPTLEVWFSTLLTHGRRKFLRY